MKKENIEDVCPDEDLEDAQNIITKLRKILRMDPNQPDDQIVPLATSVMKQLDSLKFDK